MDRENLYLTIIENLCDGVYVVDAERRIVFWNSAAENITGYKKEEIVGQYCYMNLLSHIDTEGCALCLLDCPLYKTIKDGKSRRAEVFLRHKEGFRIPVVVNVAPIEENGEIIGALEIFARNSPTVYDDSLIEKLTNLAMHDRLTGIANRVKVENYLLYKLNEIKRFKRKFCTLFLDLDNFGSFNNKYGHQLGDTILKSVVNTVSHSVRACDLFGRWGGEEFIGIFEIKEDAAVIALAEKIRVLVSEAEVEHNGEKLSVTASIGVTVARDDDTIDTLVARADALMYESKSRGKNCVTSDYSSDVL